MSTIYDAPVQPESGPRSPYEAYETWPGAGGPGGPDGPYGYGGGGDGPGGRPVRHTGRRLLMAAVALVVGGSTFAALQATGTGSAGAVQTTAQITSSVSPGLVDIVSTLGYQQAQAAGTGLVLTSSGEILTNNHVINGATSIRATDVGNGRSYTAKVVGYNQSHDIAVLQLQGASGLSTVSLGNSSTAAVGQKVVALGNAGGKGGTPSVVTGHITGLGASITASDAGAGTSEALTGLIHHNANIQPGDSGGPLVSTAGKVIGINTAASSGTVRPAGAGRCVRDPDQRGGLHRRPDRGGHGLIHGAHRGDRVPGRADHVRGQRRPERHSGGHRGPRRRHPARLARRAGRPRRR